MLSQAEKQTEKVAGLRIRGPLRGGREEEKSNALFFLNLITCNWGKGLMGPSVSIVMYTNVNLAVDFKFSRNTTSCK